jgi:hypothetical protein
MVTGRKERWRRGGSAERGWQRPRDGCDDEGEWRGVAVVVKLSLKMTMGRKRKRREEKVVEVRWWSEE